MGKAENATDHLGAGKGEAIGKQGAHEPRAFGLDRCLILAGGEQARDIGVPGWRGAPEFEKATIESVPDRDRLIKDPVSIGVALMRRGLVTFLRKESEQEI